jgi:hypothetical protein
MFGLSGSHIDIAAGEDTQCIYVFIAMQKADASPLVTFTPPALTFTANGSNPPPQTVIVQPIDELTPQSPIMTWMAHESLPWLSTKGMSEVAVTNECSTVWTSSGMILIPEIPSGELQVTVDATGLPEGTYSGQIAFEAANQPHNGPTDFPQFVPITLIVTDGTSGGGSTKLYLPLIRAN